MGREACECNDCQGLYEVDDCGVETMSSWAKRVAHSEEEAAEALFQLECQVSLLQDLVEWQDTMLKRAKHTINCRHTQHQDGGDYDCEYSQFLNDLEKGPYEQDDE